MARILIVDDEEMDRVLLHTVLGQAGHELYYASHGEAALEAYREHDVEIVITDLLMPELNGLRLIGEVRKLNPVACIIAVSGQDRKHLEEAEERGALRTLSKPVDPSELLDAVREAMERLQDLADPWG